MESAVARILDVNRNRATEALRVLEDYCRFDLDDPALSVRVKQLRHDLSEAIGPELSALIVRSRNIEGDVGRRLQSSGEYERGGASGVAAAAARRATEAVRALEEYSKTVDADRARRFEDIRYRAYEIERAALIRGQARDRLRRIKLYVIVTESFCSGHWFETAERAIRGGVDAVQLREKNLPDGELLARAKELTGLCRDNNVLFILNDRPDLARLARADGVHVGQDDVSAQDARWILEPGALVGVSTHTLEQARAASRASPDYIAVGPMFPSETKPQDHIAGPEFVRAVRAETSLPLVAIGGITPGNVAPVLKAGADCACVCSAVISQPDVAAAASDLKSRIERLLYSGSRQGERNDANRTA
jgi:thiamine-phosphate pyrophosphorylase